MRRTEERRPVVVRPAWSARVAGDLRVALQATIRNISVGGLLVHSEQQLLPGQQLEFGFQTPGGAELRLRADVRHVQHRVFFSNDIWEAGCEFRETDAAAREHLVRYVLSHQDHEATIADNASAKRAA